MRGCAQAGGRGLAGGGSAAAIGGGGRREPCDELVQLRMYHGAARDATAVEFAHFFL